MARKRQNKYSNVDPAYMEKEKNSLKRIHRKSVLFNSREVAAIEEYCRIFRVSSKSALIRQAVMERILSGLNEGHPTLF